MDFSYRRVAGLLCFAFAGFMASLLVLMAINRIFWHRGYSVVEDVIVFSVVGTMTVTAAGLGLYLRPGTFSLRTLLVGVTFAVIVMGELAYLAGG